jgi:hypothetical protein
MSTTASATFSQVGPGSRRQRAAYTGKE